MLLYTISGEGSSSTLRAFIDQFLPFEARIATASDSEAGTTRKHEILSSATHVVITEPRSGSLSLIFAILALPDALDLPRLYVVSRRPLGGILTMGEVDEQAMLQRRLDRGAAHFVPEFDILTFQEFLDL